MSSIYKTTNVQEKHIYYSHFYSVLETYRPVEQVLSSSPLMVIVMDSRNTPYLPAWVLSDEKEVVLWCLVYFTLGVLYHQTRNNKQATW